MEELLKMTVDVHVIFIMATMIMAAINVLVVNSTSEFTILGKRASFLLPMYYMCLSGVIFTGLILMGISHFNFTLSISLMLIVWLVIFVLTIKSYKALKRTRISNDPLLKRQFVWFVKRKWVTDLVLIVLITLFAWRIGI